MNDSAPVHHPEPPVERNDEDVEEDVNDNEENEEGTPAQADVPPVIRRSGRIRQPRVGLSYNHMVTDDEGPEVAKMFVAYEPTTYDEAMNADDHDK